MSANRQCAYRGPIGPGKSASVQKKGEHRLIRLKCGPAPRTPCGFPVFSAVSSHLPLTRLRLSIQSPLRACPLLEGLSADQIKKAFDLIGTRLINRRGARRAMKAVTKA